MKSDIELKRDVDAELAWDKSINLAKIGVEVSNGGSLAARPKRRWAANQMASCQQLLADWKEPK